MRWYKAIEWTGCLMIVVGLMIILTPRAHVPSDRKLDAIKDCNRLGGIYTEGVCQHPFAPICRRVGAPGTYHKRE